MDARILANYRSLATSGARMVLLEYFESKLEVATQSLVSCTVKNFQQYQGRVLELQAIIKELKELKREQ